MASASTSRETNEQIMAWDVAIADYRCLEFFPIHQSLSKCTNETRLLQPAQSRTLQIFRSEHSPLEARCIPLLSPGCLLAPPPYHVQDAGPPVTHDDVTNVTAPRSHSHHHRHSAAISLSLYIMTSQCHITQGPHWLSVVRAHSLTSSLARGGGLTADCRAEISWALAR